MKDHAIRACLSASACLGFCVSAATAQEALRASLSGEDAVTLRRKAFEDQVANVKWDDASLLVGSALAVELNDNVGYSDQFRQQDIIFHPGLSLLGTIQLTGDNAIFASLDVGYSKYLKYSQYDKVVVEPGTQLGLDLYVKDFHFNLHDDIAVTDVPVAQGTISNAGNYGEFSNTAGITADWDLNKVIATMGFDHENSIATVSSFSYLDRRSENFFLRASCDFSPTFSGGPEASTGLTYYDQHVLDDSINYSLGVFANWQATAHIAIRPRVGFTEFIFSKPSNGLPPTPNSSSYYMAVVASHRLNDFVTYGVDAGRQLRLGINSELLSLWYAHPSADWKLVDQVGINTHMIFENGTDSGTAFLPGSAEIYTLLGGGISLTFRPMEKLLVGLNYDYTIKDSNIPDRSYHQNRIQLRFQYTF